MRTVMIGVARTSPLPDRVSMGVALLVSRATQHETGDRALHARFVRFMIFALPLNNVLNFCPIDDCLEGNR